jgi:hypothetical protein
MTIHLVVYVTLVVYNPLKGFSSLFFFFLDMSAQMSGGGFELVTSSSLGVVLTD